MRARRAKLSDAAAIHALIAHYAAQGLLLPAPRKKFARNIGHFLVLEENRRASSAASPSKATAPISPRFAPSPLIPKIRGRGIGRDA